MPTAPQHSAAQTAHVVLLVEENHSYDQIVGTADMPYLNTLIAQYGLATEYYANSHPSIGNYFDLTTGQTISTDDNFSGTVTADNIVREMIASKTIWKGYAESLPSVGYLGPDRYPYKRAHLPLSYFSDLTNNSAEANHLVPFTQFATDLATDSLPQYSFVVPNLLNDAHDGTIAQADAWLESNLAPLLSNPSFQRDGLLIITFDEGEIADLAHGGGHVVTVVIGPKVKLKFRSASFYQHQNVLALICATLGLARCPGQAASASNMSEFF